MDRKKCVVAGGEGTTAGVRVKEGRLQCTHREPSWRNSVSREGKSRALPTGGDWGWGVGLWGSLLKVFIFFKAIEARCGAKSTLRGRGGRGVWRKEGTEPFSRREGE